MSSTLAQRQQQDLELIKAHNGCVRELFDDHFERPRQCRAWPADVAAIDKADVCFAEFRAMSVELGYVVLDPDFSFADLVGELGAVGLQEVQRALARMRDELRRRKLQDAPMLLRRQDVRRYFGQQVPF